MEKSSTAMKTSPSTPSPPAAAAIAKRSPASLRHQSSAVSVRTSKSHSTSEKIQSNAREREKVLTRYKSPTQELEQKPEDLRGRRGRSESTNTAKSRPFGGKLRIDVDAAEMAASAAIISPLSYYSSKRLPSFATEEQSLSLFTAVESHAGSGLLSSTSPFLEYGMIVSLVCDDRNGLVAAEGFASRDVRLEDLNYGTEASIGRLGLGGMDERRLFAEGEFRLLSCPFHECLFEVVPKMTYDATLALRSLDGEASKSPQRHIKQHTPDNLRFKSEAESRLNAMMYKKLMGTWVIYGQTIQLRHVKSGKYVSLDRSTKSFRGSEYAPVFLDTSGPSSHFNVLPRFKLRSKGAPVQLTDQLILTGGTEAEPLNLFVTNRKAANGASTGVVGSRVHSSQFRAVYYDSLSDKGVVTSGGESLWRKNDGGLRAGSCIRLFHLESSSWLSHREAKSRDFPSGLATLQYSDESEQEDRAEKALPPDSLWEVERVSVYEGGQVKWRESVTLRHLLTGKYLAIAHQHSPRSTARSAAAMRPLSHNMCAQVIAQQQPQIFRFVPTAVAGEEDQIETGNVALIQHQKTNSFIHSIDTHTSSMTEIRLSSKPLVHTSRHNTNGDTFGGASFDVVTLRGARDEDAFKIVTVPQVEVTDTLLLVSYKKALISFLDQFDTRNLIDERSCLRFELESTIATFRRVETILAELITFCGGAEENLIGQMRCRQSLFRTHQYIELLVEMIKAPFQCYGGPFTIEEVCSYNDDYMDSSRDPYDDDELNGPYARQSADSYAVLWGCEVSPNNRGLISPRRLNSTQDSSWRRKGTGGGSTATSRLDTHMAAMQSLNRIIPAINVLLLQISWSNRTNELYVVKVAMPVLIDLLGNGFETALPLSYLLRENRNLTESITGYTSIIRNFFELIATRGKSIRYVQFLVALCTSRGKGIPMTQEAICELLFSPVSGYRDDVVVPIRPSENGFDICTCSHFSSTDVNQDIEAMFNESAKTKAIDRDTGVWMPLAKFYEEYYVKAKYRALGQYCYGLFRLYASLCLDRNYVSIEYVQTAFPRENLLHCVKDSFLARSLRSVMMDLLRVAYVDCEPQKTMSCPNYTRIWTDIGASAKEPIPEFSCAGYAPEDLAFFSSLKDFCRAYLDQLEGVIVIDEIPENELTLAILRISRKMTEFGMYSTEAELSRFVAQLFDLLDERTDFVRERPVFYGNEHHEHKKPFNLPSAIHWRRKANPINAQASLAHQQQKAPLKSAGNDPRSDAPSQPSAYLRDTVFFDGAGAMSSIRVTRERDASRQYRSSAKGGARLPTEELSGVALSSESGAYRQFNKLQIHKSDMHARQHVNVHEMNEVNRVVMEIKDEICAIFLLVDQMRVDYLISTLLASFQAQHGCPSSNLPNRHCDRDTTRTAPQREQEPLSHVRLHSAKMSPLAFYLFGCSSLECKLSLSQLGRKASTTIFMQMLMYEYPPLVSKALELLLQQYNQHDQLLKELQSVQLLVSEETITIYNKLKGDVDELRRLAETTEVWMDLTSRSDFERAASVCHLLQSLVRVIEHTTIDDPTVNVETRESQVRRRLKLRAPGNSMSEDHIGDNGNSAADLFATNSKCALHKVTLSGGNTFKLVQRTSIEKEPPNRKLATGRYILSPSSGRVSYFSCSHEVIPPFQNIGDDASLENVNDADKTMAMEARRLLRNLKAARYVLNMLTDGAHFYEGHLSLYNDEQQHSPGSPTTRSRAKLHKRQRDQIRGVFGKAIQFLRVFCVGDMENQALIAPHATMIAQYVRDLPIAQELLVAIYADNVSLYNAVPTKLINTFVGHLIHAGPDPRYLLFLETIVLCNEQPVFDNQLLVLFQLVKSFENAKVLQMFDDADRTVKLFERLFRRHAYRMKGEADAYRRAELGIADPSHIAADTDAVLRPDTTHAADTGSNLPNGIVDTDEILEYHVRLLHLFAACATGKNTKVQEICQQILPLVNLLALLNNDGCTEGMQLAMLRFMTQIFLTADDIESPSTDELMQIMVVLSQVCERQVIKYLACLQAKDLALRKKKSKLGNMVSLSVQKPLENASLYVVIHYTIPTLYSFIQHFPDFVENNEEVQYCLVHFHSFVAMLLLVCATSKWQLSESFMNDFEEYLYVIDKTVRPSKMTLVQTSLEQMWSISLAYHERLDCSSLNCEEELFDMLHWALEKRDNEPCDDTSLGFLSSKGSMYSNESMPTTFPERDTSPLRQAIQDSISDSSSPKGNNGADGLEFTGVNDKTTTSFKLDTITSNKPVTWGDSVSKELYPTNKESLFEKKSCHNNEVVDTVHRRSIFHRLSTRHHHQGLRTGKDGSPKRKGSPVAPFSMPTTQASNASIGTFDIERADGICQRQHLSELDQFLSWLQAHPRVHAAMRDELNQMVEGILNIERSTKEEYDASLHVRNVVLSFDLVVAKLVKHVEALQDSRYLKTNLTLLDVFCRMIYAAEDAQARHSMQIKLNQLGVTRLVVQLIASRGSDALFTSSIEVGVALLDGMNAEVQESFYRYWNEPSNEGFFERIQDRIEMACKLIHSADRSVGTLSILRAHDTKDDPEDVRNLHHRSSIHHLDPTMSAMDKEGSKRHRAPVTSIFRFLQLLCEGHYLNAQRALITQPNAKVSVNLVESTTSFLLETYLALTDMNMDLITQLFETITEYCQGPCVEAQETVANYKFINAANALLTHSFDERDARAQDAVHQLCAAIVVTLLSLLEGRCDRTIHTQLVQELDFEALKMNLVKVYAHFLCNHGTYAGNPKCNQDFYLTMGFNIYILLQQLADQHSQQAWWIPLSESGEYLEAETWQSSQYKMHIGDGVSSPLNYGDAFRFFQSNCGKVEVLWDHHRFSAARSADYWRINLHAGERSNASLMSDTGGNGSKSTHMGALVPFYFPVHPICFCLTVKSKKKLIRDVSRGSDKLLDFYARSDKLVDEMTHQCYLQHHRRVSWIARKSEEIKRLSFSLAVLINLVVLLFYRAAGIDSRPFAASEVSFIHNWSQQAVEPPEPSLAIDAALTLGGSLQIFLYTTVLLCYMLNSAPLLIKKGWKRRHRQEQAKLSKQSADHLHHRSVESKEHELLKDTEHLLLSLREREEMYSYLLLPPPARRRHVSTPRGADATRISSAKISAVYKEIGTHRSRLCVRFQILGISLYFLVRSPRVIYSLLQILVSVLGAYVNKLYFAFLLLDVVDRYKDLNNVLRSISRPAKALGVTTLLYLVVVYVFAVVDFFFFREDYTSKDELTPAQREGRAPYTCQRLFQCFLVSLDQGLKGDGGLGTFLRQLPLGESAHSYGRLVFDVLFNIILVVLLLNLVFGVIIDTFASLRTDDQEKTQDMQERCFICSIDAYTFDRATKRGFHDHISRDHNMWHYLYLFVHLRKKSITDYNGLELFLAMRMAKKDMSFFPTHRALSLTKREDLEGNFEQDFSVNDDRFYLSSGFRSRRNVVTPFSPTNVSSLSFGARPSSDQCQSQLHSRRDSSASSLLPTATRSTGSFDSPALPSVQSVDPAPAKRLERIEATINTLAGAQVEIKDAQRRAQEQYSEILAIISRLHSQSTLLPSPLPQSTPDKSISGCSPALSRSEPDSVIPRIFNFGSVANGVEEATVGSKARGERQTLSASASESSLAIGIPSPTPSSISRTLDSITPRTLNVETDTSFLESEEDGRPNFGEESQDWFSASPEHHVPAPSPQNASHLQHGSVASRLPSSPFDDIHNKHALSQRASIDLDERLQQLPTPSRKPDMVMPQAFNFEFISDDEEEHESDSPHPKPRKR